jgi:putative glycosyltransferase (TIGR04372 family)
VRDADYLNKVVNKDTSYHDYRDSDLSNYYMAVEYLLEQGYTVIQMGKYSKQKLQLKHESFVNLNGLGEGPERDKLDVLVLQKCDFLIGTNCGLGDLAASMKVPFLVTNSAPFFPYYHNKCRILPKILKHKNSNFKLAFSHWFDSEKVQIDEKPISMCVNGEKLSKAGFVYEECSAVDILEATIEFIKICELQRFEEPTKLQSQCWKALPKDVWFNQFKCWISDSFLQRHKDFFIDKEVAGDYL